MCFHGLVGCGSAAGICLERRTRAITISPALCSVNLFSKEPAYPLDLCVGTGVTALWGRASMIP